MRIGIEAKLLFSPSGGGALRYIQNLLQGLAEIDTSNEYFVYLDNEWPLFHQKGLDFLLSSDNFVVRIPKRLHVLYDPLFRTGSLLFHGWYRYGYFEQFFLPASLADDRVDVFHATQTSLPIVKVAKTVMTVHYLTPTLHPESASGSFQTYFFNVMHTLLTPGTLKRADTLIAVGQTVKSELCRHYDISPERVQVVHPGISNQFRVIDNNRNDAPHLYHIDSDYVLVMDSSSFSGEFEALFRAVRQLKARGGWRYKIVIAGQLSTSNRLALVRSAERFGLTNDIVLTGYITDEDLVKLHNAASLFVYPSSHEGFGIVPIEAMACGTPVIAISGISPMIHEMVGDAAPIVNPHDTESLVSTIGLMLSDDSVRQKFRERGFRHARRFRWRAIAEQTLSIYRTLVES